MDQPTIDGVNTYVVSAAAREAGLPVALAGVGGDELFAGYPAFTRVPRMVKAARLTPSAAMRAVAPLAPRASRDLERGARIARWLRAGGAGELAYDIQRELFSPALPMSSLPASSARRSASCADSGRRASVSMRFVAEA
jgi:asparagine synthase (glutamine-hydrolysing)